MSDSELVQIRLVVEMVLEREGIVIARQPERPMQGFSLTAASRLDQCVIKSLTIARACDDHGVRRRDLVALCLMARTDAREFSGGDEVLLTDVEACGFLRQ